jgi:hypothetical protein
MIQMTRKSRRRAAMASFAFAAALLTGYTWESAKSAQPAAAAAAAPLRLPVSMLDVMRASVEIPADGLWAAESAAKLSDQDWLLADQDAADLAAATALMSLPGTGKNDQKWIANADWHMWTLDVQKTALAIRQAVKAKNQMMLASGADHLADTCQTCHDKYRPETPSDGIIRYPFYPKRVPAK